MSALAERPFWVGVSPVKGMVRQVEAAGYVGRREGGAGHGDDR